MNKKNWMVAVGCVCLVCTLLFPVDSGWAQKKPVVIKAGHVVPRNFLYDAGLQKFREIVENETKGQLKVEIYPQGQLGSERELIEGVQVGTIQMAVINSAPCTGFIPEIGVFSLPYLFPKRESAFRVFDGPIGRSLLDKFDRLGIKAMTLWDGGKRGLITNTKPIKVPEDLKGLKVRCMEDPVMLSTFKACDAIPTPIPWGEVYTSLQQKTVDVVETCIQMMELNRFHEVGKYVSFTDHYWTPAPHIVNMKFFNGLSKDFQKIIWKASEIGRDVCRKDIMPGGANADDQSLKNMEKKGVTIVPVDYEVWRKKLQPTYQSFYGKFGKDLIEKIMAEAK
jgi:tripartite ATP-independent transporter DctP family solute receptor